MGTGAGGSGADTGRVASGLAWRCAAFAVISAVTGALAASQRWWVLTGLAAVGGLLYGLMAREFWTFADLAREHARGPNGGRP